MNSNTSVQDLRSPMVSQPHSPHRAFSVRGPPSVSSRTTTGRRNRYNRSHNGGSTYQPHNEFPFFGATGDVEIVISAGAQENRYLLHRLILSQCSGFFEAGTSDVWSHAQAQGQGQSQGPDQAMRLGRIGEDDVPGRELGIAGAGPVVEPQRKTRWRYELDWVNKVDELPLLVQKAPSSTLFGGDQTPQPPPIRKSNKPPPPQAGFFRSMANLSAMHSAMNSAIQIPHSNPAPDSSLDTLHDYENLFRIFYNYAPMLDGVNIANAYIECKSLLALADMYDALDVVGPRIDHHLLQFQGRLWKQIAKYPPSYLKLGYLARSKVIFSEALIHVVGQWPAGTNQLRNNLPDMVLDVVEDKVEELEDMKAKIEGRLFRLNLTTSRGERVSPTNSYQDWMAVSLFRQWLAENTTPPPVPIMRTPHADPRRPAPPVPPPPPLNTGKIYRVLGTGGSSYLAHDELKRFLKLRPEDYSRDNLKRFEKRMDEIKNLAREIVKPLMKDFLELDLGRDGGSVGYLTCTKVEEVDYPWD